MHRAAVSLAESSVRQKGGVVEEDGNGDREGVWGLGLGEREEGRKRAEWEEGKKH